MDNHKTKITVEASINAPLEKVWDYWTRPEHIVEWNAASDDWHTPRAENDLRTGGAFMSRMEAKDGSAGFDFGGTYTDVVPQKHIAYTMEDGRTVEVLFQLEGEGVKIIETFDAEDVNPIEMQQGGWQAILDRFQRYVETQ